MGAQKSDASKPNHDPKAYEDEEPDFVVALDSYRIGRYPVTVVEYQRFLESGAYTDSRYWAAVGSGWREAPDAWKEQLQFPNRPVVGVSWYQALAYCRWAGGTLPSEAEWERAARGTQGRRFPWGNEPPDPSRCNYAMNIEHPTPVGLATYGSGRGASGERSRTRRISGIRTMPATGVRTWKRARTSAASFGAAGSAAIPGTSAVRPAAGAFPTTTTSTSVFGWSCAHDSGR